MDGLCARGFALGDKDLAASQGASARAMQQLGEPCSLAKRREAPCFHDRRTLTNPFHADEGMDCRQSLGWWPELAYVAGLLTLRN